MGGVQETPDAAGPPPAPVPLRRNTGFRFLWIGQVLSETGNYAAEIAYPLLILALTHSPVIAGAVGTVRLAAQIILGLPGGAVSDRLDRRLTMITCDTARAILLAVLAVLVLLHAVSWPVVLVVSVLDGGLNVLFDPSAMAALPGIVADQQLEQAWAATEARTYTASLAGPALGGFLFELGSAVPFAGDALSYVISAATVSRIPGTFRPRQSGERKRLWRETVEGLRLVWRNPLLRAVVIQAPLVNFSLNGVFFTIILALRRDGAAPGVIGLVQAGIAVGGLLGALIAPKVQGRLRLQHAAVALTVSASILFGIAAFLIPSPLVVLPVSVTLLVAPATNAALFAAMLRTTPQQMHGRVNSTVIMAATALSALAPLTSGLLIEHLSDRWTLTAFTATMIIAAIAAMTLPGFRNADRAAGRTGTPGQ